MNAELHVPFVEKLPDDDFFTVNQLAEADMLVQSDPAKVSDRQLGMIACYDYNGAQVAARRRAEARAKAAEPPPAQPAPSAPVVAKAKGMPHARLPVMTEETDLSTPEKLRKWAEENPTAAVPLVLWEMFVRGNRDRHTGFDAEVRRLGDLLVLTEQRLATLEAAGSAAKTDWLDSRVTTLSNSCDARLAMLEEKVNAPKADDELEARLARLESLLIVLDNEVKVSRELHEKTAPVGFRWAGEYSPGAYKAGEVVKHRGSTWIAIADTTAAPGMAPADWDLMLKAQAQK